jgi:hypothetical protein
MGTVLFPFEFAGILIILASTQLMRENHASCVPRLLEFDLINRLNEQMRHILSIR